MTPQEIGRRRDAAILALVEKFGVLRTDQLEDALFRGKAGTRACQRRLQILTRRGLLHRERMFGGPYLYRVDTRTKQVEHRQAVADIYLRALRERRAGERIEFVTEYALAGGDRADALITWHTPTLTAYAFLEVQRRGKAQLGKYRRHYLSGLWTAPIYPRIVVAGEVGRVPTGLTVVELAGSVRAAMVATSLQPMKA